MVKLGPGTFFVGEGEDLDSIFKTLSLAIRLRVHTCIGPLQTLTGEVLRSPEQRLIREQYRLQGLNTISEQHVEHFGYRPNRRLHV